MPGRRSRGPAPQARPGRLLLWAAGLAALLFLASQVVELPAALVLARRVLSIASLLGAAWLLVAAIVGRRRELLWPVRGKLLVSYLFLGIVPLILLSGFLLVGGMLLYTTVTSYLFAESYTDAVEDVRQIAATLAVETGASGADAAMSSGRAAAALPPAYASLRVRVVPVDGDAARGMPAVPAWLPERGGFAGTVVAAEPGTIGEWGLLIRVAAFTPDGRHVVLADLPVDAAVVARLEERSAARLASAAPSDCAPGGGTDQTLRRSVWAPFSETVTLVDCTIWESGAAGVVPVRLDAPASRVVDQLASVQPAAVAALAGGSWWTVFVQLLVVLAVLAVIIQGAALFMGFLLARSITSAVHELFVGTGRIQQGDFTYRIPIASRDQLGGLAESFNRMSASIEHLLVVQRDKQRLDDELRIAREIQRSLLPVAMPEMKGLGVAALCEPAREVGGDYYDLFVLGPRQLGVLIADVSGKGTSAALYMAELRGLMLALSRAQLSPRQLLIDVNRRLADELRGSSFITMTYAVIDLERGMLTHARAGHTPLLVVGEDGHEFLVPPGMVVGLRLPGAETRFEELLVEHTREIRPGDLIVLYTDGITEAIDAGGELFGPAALAREVAEHRVQGPAVIRDRVVETVRTFVGDADPHDDMTMVVIEIGGGRS